MSSTVRVDESSPATPVESFGRLTDLPRVLSQFWLVEGPKALAPWAPQLADALSDGAWTAPWRTLTSVVPILGLAFGALIPLVWPGASNVYSGSPLFLVVIVGGAILSGQFGLTLLVGYVAGDVLSGGGEIGRAFYSNPARTLIEKSLQGTGSQLISYILLAAPAVGTPQLARSLARSVSINLPGRLGSTIRSSSILHPLLCGLLAYLWCQGMTVLAGPVFTWRGGQLTPDTIRLLQFDSLSLGGIAILTGLVRTRLERVALRRTPWRTASTRARQLRWQLDPRRGERWLRLPTLVRVALPAGIITLTLSGAYGRWTDALIVAAIAGIEGALRAGLLGFAPSRWWKSTSRVSPFLRFAVALVVGYLGFYLTSMFVPGAAHLGSSRPVLAGIVLALTAFHILFPRRLLTRPIPP